MTAGDPSLIAAACSCGTLARATMRLMSMMTKSGWPALAMSPG
jgi:hypothetical protein